MRTFNGLQIFTDQLTNSGQLDLRYVRITGNQNISNVKNFLTKPTVNGVDVALVGEAGGGVNVQDQGSSLGAAGTLNFAGAGVSTVFAGGTATVNIAGGGGPTNLPNGILFVSGSQTISGSKLISGVGVSFNFISGAALRISGNSVITGVDLSSYLTSATASSTYLTQTNAASTFSTISNLNALSGNSVLLSGPTQTINSSKLISGVGVSYYFISGAALRISGNRALTGINIQDEGSMIGAADVLNFAGAGVSTAFAGGIATVNIAGGGGSSFTSPPATPTSAGTLYDLATDSNYLYVCVATNTWVRTALASTW